MSFKKADLDDVASRSPGRDLSFPLEEVGIENVQMMVLRDGQRMPARGYASVSLTDPSARGIHMSRLFKILTQFNERELSWEWLSECVGQMLSSHANLSDAADLKVDLEWPVLRPALLSQEQGWRTYPVSYRVHSSGGRNVQTLTLKVLYSSTCPCSASLSRQAMQEKFKADFPNRTIDADKLWEWLGHTTVGTPHSQRSEAVCELTLKEGTTESSPVKWIDLIETALGTPVQAAVKREDEQEFARLNADNLMFCEDAARKLKAALMRQDQLADFKIEVKHFESLHAHDVVARARK